MKSPRDFVSDAFGDACDHEQAEFLNSLVASVWASCKHSEEKVNNQICFISDDLNPLSQKFFLELAEYIKLEIEQEKKGPKP